MMKSALVLTAVLFGQMSFAQTTNELPTYNALAQYSLSMSGPDNDIFLKVRLPGGELKTFDLHHHAVSKDPDKRSKFYTYVGNNQTYLFDTDPSIGEVAYADLKLDWKELVGNLGCLGGFDGDSLFITEYRGKVRLQAYCGSKGYGELYIRSFDGIDWDRRVPSDGVLLNPKAIATETNFYTFYVRESNHQFKVIDGDKRLTELSVENPHDVVNVIDVTKSKDANGLNLITIRSKFDTGEILSMVLREEADGQTLTTVSNWGVN